MDIEALAHREAWRYKKSSDPHHSDTYTFNRSTLLEFARKLMAAEREACAKVCEAMIDPVDSAWRNKRPDEAAEFDASDAGKQACADAIRMRSNVESRGASPEGAASRLDAGLEHGG